MIYEMLIVAVVLAVFIAPLYAYILIAMRGYLSDRATKDAISNTMIAKYNADMMMGESREIAEAKVAQEILKTK